MGGRGRDGAAYTACLRACMAAYRKLRGPGDGEAEIGERGRRRKLNEDEEDAEEAAARERVTGEWGKTRTDHEEATYGDARPCCSKDGKVEEHPLEPVRLLGACSESRPGEARRQIFATLILARPLNTSRFEPTRNIKLYGRNNIRRYALAILRENSIRTI